MSTTSPDTRAPTQWRTLRGRYVDVTFMLKKGESEFLVTLRKGEVESIVAGPHVMPRWTFRLAADDDTWDRFWAPEPQPRFHDLMAMVKFKTLRVEGDQAVFMSNLLYFKELVRELGGRIQGGARHGR